MFQLPINIQGVQVQKYYAYFKIELQDYAKTNIQCKLKKIVEMYIYIMTHTHNWVVD